MLRRFFPFADSLWTQRELLWQFTIRNVELRHKGSHLGLIWSVLNPLLMVGIYVFAFGYIFKGSYGVIPDETHMDYALGMLLSLALFHLVAETLATSPTIIVGNPNFVKKVVFPLEILPAANVTSALFHMSISLGLVIVSLLFSGHGYHSGIWWMPVIIFPLLMLCLGISWLFSALGVFLRDVGQVMQFLTMALMFSSGVFYSSQKIPTEAWTFLRFNPVLIAIDLARDAALWNRPLNYVHLLYLYLVGLAACYIGHSIFQRMKPAFADVL